MARQNIILIICDQLRADALGADGNRRISTPNLDGLAVRGTLFRHAYSAVPSCLPAHASLWTGQDQWHAGLLGMGRGQGQIPNDYPHTLPGEMSRGGGLETRGCGWVKDGRPHCPGDVLVSPFRDTRRR